MGFFDRFKKKNKEDKRENNNTQGQTETADLQSEINAIFKEKNDEAQKQMSEWRKTEQAITSNISAGYNSSTTKYLDDIVTEQTKKFMTEMAEKEFDESFVGKKYKNHPDVEKESNQPFGFVKYKTDTGQENKPENNDIVCAYPEEWMKRRIGINYFIREQRDSMINAITEEDIEETGVVVENPVIGHIPSRQEIVNELEELLMTM